MFLNRFNECKNRFEDDFDDDMPIALTQRQDLKMFKDVLHYYCVVDYNVRKLYFNVDYNLFDEGAEVISILQGFNSPWG